MRGKNSTIYDVAKVAGVSISTVSRVLNSPHQVSELTRKKVLKAIEQLKYVPKAEASARARKKFRRIGALTPSLTVPSFVERFRGIANALHGTNYELIVYLVENSTQLQHYLDMLSVSKRIDGLITITLPIDEDSLKHIISNDIEIVCIEDVNPFCCNIIINNTLGGQLAAKHFLKKGYRRCAYVGENFGPVPKQRERLHGFREALCEAGVGLPDEYIRLFPSNMDDVVKHMDDVVKYTSQLLDLSSPPEAIFTYSDLHAIGVLKAARLRKIHIPDELAVIGFDNIDAAEFMELTTIDQHLEESGKVAVEVLLSRIAGKTQSIQNIELQIHLKERSTT